MENAITLFLTARSRNIADRYANPMFHELLTLEIEERLFDASLFMNSNAETLNDNVDFRLHVSDDFYNSYVRALAATNEILAQFLIFQDRAQDILSLAIRQKFNFVW